MRHGNHHGPRGPRNDSQEGGRGPRKPGLEDVTQEVINNEDGSIDITVSGTGRDGEIHTRSVNISDNEAGGINISSSNEEHGTSKTTTISEDTEDGGVDIDIVMTNEEGETFTKHLELDLNDDGTLSIESAFDKDGELIIHEHSVDLARFLGEEGEELSVAEVVEAYLDKGPFDMTDVELTGLNNLATGAEVLDF